jgi:hypothetical protein
MLGADHAARRLLFVLSDRLAGVDHRGCIHAVAEVSARPRRAADDCGFQRLCLQANGSQLSVPPRPAFRALGVYRRSGRDMRRKTKEERLDRACVFARWRSGGREHASAYWSGSPIL